MMSHILNSKYLRVLLVSSLVLAGCSKGVDSNGGSTSAQGGVITPIPDPTVVPGTLDNHPLSALTTGATVDFTFDSIATLNSYVQMHPVNDPQNMKMNVQLQQLTDSNGNLNGQYAGTILLGYYDTGNYYIATFQSGFGFNQVSYKNQTTGKPEGVFNQWFQKVLNSTNVLVFHGFFQDNYGAIVLVIDGGVDQGDGAGYTSVNGSVYFKNFGVGYATQSPEKCWFIVTGPYDCRSFLTGSGSRDEKRVSTTSAIYPSTSDGYQRLGTFQGLDKIKAFGN